MSPPFDPAPAAALLAAARLRPDRIDVLPDAVRPQDAREGYVLQRRLAQALGEPIAGYKLGLSSRAGMERSGLGAPVAGFVPRRLVHPSGATLDMPEEGTVLIEVEVVFTLARTVEPGAPLADLRDLVASAHLGFEFVRSRFRDRNAAGLPSFIGDGSGFHALVLGDALPLDDLPGLLAGGAALFRDGALAARAAIGLECPDPFEALARFLPLAAEHGMPLAAGTLVATGDLVQPLETAEPGRYEGRLGPATVTIHGRRPPTRPADPDRPPSRPPGVLP